MVDDNKAQSIYCYTGTDVLINNLTFENKRDLKDAERMITTFKLAQLEMNSYPFTLDLDVHHYIQIHKHLFSDIYPFAGEIRGESITKSNAPYSSGITPFCYPSFIYKQLDYLLLQMRANMHHIYTKEQFIQLLAYYYTELNIVHPFREGNGRVLREYLREFVEKANFEGYRLNYNKWGEEDRNNLLKHTIIATISGETTGIEELFGKVLVAKEYEISKVMKKAI